MIETKYSDSQPRDEHGRWSSGGSTSIAEHAQTTASTFGNIVGAAATGVLAATVLAAALKKPAKIPASRFSALTPEIGKKMIDLLHGSLGRAMTEAESAAAKVYTSGVEGAHMNKKLRTGKLGPLDNLPVIAQLDKLVSESKIPQDLKLYRGVGGKHVEGWIPGATVTDAAFGSTSISRRVAEQFAARDPKNGVVIHIEVEKGKNALPLPAGHSHFASENEVMLPRNSSYRILERQGRHIRARLL